MSTIAVGVVGFYIMITAVTFISMRRHNLGVFEAKKASQATVDYQVKQIRELYPLSEIKITKDGYLYINDNKHYVTESPVYQMDYLSMVLEGAFAQKQKEDSR